MNNPTCPLCDMLFRTTGRKLYCSVECEQAAEVQHKRRKSAKKAIVTQPNDIEQIMSILIQYNRDHGTHLSYGQYVHRMRIGTLEEGVHDE